MSRRIILLVLCVLGLGRPGWPDSRDFVSPGALTRAHRQVACESCHVPYGGIQDSMCLACHAKIAENLRDKSGYHGKAVQGACVSCHTDHKGEVTNIPLLPKSFTHDQTSFVLRGKHVGIACEKCHQATSVRKYQGTSARCASCHTDKHRGGLGNACERCHQPVSFAEILPVAKEHRVSLEKGHAKATCQSCHPRGNYLQESVDCSSCHKKSHVGTFATCKQCHDVSTWKEVAYRHVCKDCIPKGKHESLACLACHPSFGFAKTAKDCAGCHDTQRPHEPLGRCDKCHSTSSWKTLKFDHDRKSIGFPLHGKHLAVTCESCHPKSGTFKLQNSQCATCHAVPAHGDFGRCEKCHNAYGFSPSSFRHESTGYVLEGAHGKAACQGCHSKTTRIHQIPKDCVACHPNKHQGRFTREASVLEVLRTFSPNETALLPRCSRCHTATSWVPSSVTVADHQNFAFQLRGKHLQASCGSCHKQGLLADTPSSCSGCHEDVRHRGKLGSQCEKCHESTAWKPVVGFTHDKTRFVLDGRHTQVKCQACHGEAGTDLFAKRQPITCASCHESKIHGKQFGSECATCHTTQTFSATKRFDHETTSFPLRRRHTATACLACHDVRKQPLLNRNCAGCHGDPHRISNGFTCEDCHREDRWRVIRFDHDSTDFPLTGRHVVASCGDCHTNPIWNGLSAECFTCHGRDTTQRAEHVGAVQCEECHVTSTWRLTK